LVYNIESTITIPNEPKMLGVFYLKAIFN